MLGPTSDMPKKAVRYKEFSKGGQTDQARQLFQIQLLGNY